MDSPIRKRERQFIIILVMVGLIAGISLFLPKILDLLSGDTKVNASAAASFRTPTASTTVSDQMEISPISTDIVLGVISTDINIKEKYGCTLDKNSWISNLESWPLQEVLIGGETYSRDKLRYLTNLTSPNAQESLLIELVVYTLNVYQGADGASIAQTVAAAINWLDEHPEGSGSTRDQLENADRLAGILRDFNQGNIGPGLCEETVISPDPSTTLPNFLTLTFTPVFTPIISEIPPSASATLIYVPLPTSTKKPDNDNPPPPPVATQRPPTARPSEPPSTSAPTPAER